MRRQFHDTVLELAEHDERIAVIVGDISGFLFRDFAAAYPDRFYNMGICENTLISVTAGMSSQGFHPFVHTINPFLTDRSYEQIKLDLCYNGWSGNIVTCGASFDYAWDGATHHTYTELAMLRLLPGIEVLQPGNKKEADALIRSQYANGKPTYFRMSDHSHDMETEIEFGKGVVVKDKQAPVTVITAGPILANVLPAVEDLDVNLLYFHTLKPLDAELIARYRDTRILVVHDAFGLHEAVAAAVPDLRIAYHGMPDQFCCFYGSVHDIRKEIGLDPDSIREAVRKRLSQAAEMPA